MAYYSPTHRNVISASVQYSRSGCFPSTLQIAVSLLVHARVYAGVVHDDDDDWQLVPVHSFHLHPRKSERGVALDTDNSLGGGVVTTPQGSSYGEA